MRIIATQIGVDLLITGSILAVAHGAASAFVTVIWLSIGANIIIRREFISREH